MAQRRQPDRHAMRHISPAQHTPPTPMPPPQNGDMPSKIGQFLHELDSERLALLGLLYVLYKEGADARLLLAIAYILL